MGMQFLKLRHVNNLLFTAIIVVLGYVIAAPLMPVVSYWIDARTGTTLQKLSDQVTLPAGQVENAPGDDRLVVPSMLLDQPINEGKDLSALRTGTWRRPNGSTPDKGGNTVIVGHRFTYTNPRGSFYFLNKVAVGDEIGVFWHGKRYVYKVSNVKTVAATDTSVEDPSSRPELTLYTCTPLWLPKDRLVVTADLEHPEKLNP
jgi:LPXTG-site transpeptidase (sortase) family protein